MYQMLSQEKPHLIAQIKDRLNRKTLDELTMEALQQNRNLMTEVKEGLSSSLEHAAQVATIVQKTEQTIASQLAHHEHGALIAEALSQTIQTDRGLQNETNVLDLYEKETGTLVTERNTKTRSKLYSDSIPWTLVGRIDGLVGNRIVDAKERKRKWTHVPEYDMIQMRAYMEL